MSTTPADEDTKTERAVLAFVLNLHPTRLSLGALVWVTPTALRATSPN